MSSPELRSPDLQQEFIAEVKSRPPFTPMNSFLTLPLVVTEVAPPEEKQFTTQRPSLRRMSNAILDVAAGTSLLPEPKSISVSNYLSSFCAAYADYQRHQNSMAHHKSLILHQNHHQKHQLSEMLAKRRYSTMALGSSNKSGILPSFPIDILPAAAEDDSEEDLYGRGKTRMRSSSVNPTQRMATKTVALNHSFNKVSHIENGNSKEQNGRSPSIPPQPKVVNKKYTAIKSRVNTASDYSPRPSGVKIFDKPLKFANVSSKVGSLQNVTHKPGGGKVKIETKNLDFTHTTPKIQSKSTVPIPTSNVKIETKKLQWKAESKVGSRNNVAAAAGQNKNKPPLNGGNVIEKGNLTSSEKVVEKQQQIRLTQHSSPPVAEIVQQKIEDLNISSDPSVSSNVNEKFVQENGVVDPVQEYSQQQQPTHQVTFADEKAHQLNDDILYEHDEL